MAQARHTVVSGDNLWNISKTYLGDGRQWPRIWRYNNRRDVVAVTGRAITNPDLIHPGQTILLPIAQGIGAHRSGHGGTTHAPHHAPTQSAATHQPGSNHQPSAQPVRTQHPGSSAGHENLHDQLPSVKSPVVFKYKLEDIKFPPVYQPGVIIEMKMTGSILLSTKENFPALYVTQREIELAVTQNAHNSLNQLLNKTTMIYEPGQNKLTMRSMLVTQSKNPNLPTFAVGTQIDSHSPMPKLRFEIKLPKLEGTIGNFFYLAEEVTYVVELTPQPGGPPHQGPSAQPVRSPSINWGKVGATGLIVVAGGIVVATLIEDFFTGGAGIADDPASFAAAGASYARGMSMLRGLSAVRTVGTVLPRAAIPAALRLEWTFRAAPVAVPAFAH